MLKSILILISIFSYTGCKQANKNSFDQANNFFLTNNKDAVSHNAIEFNFSSMEHKISNCLNKNPLTVVYYFDGECSSCIINFIEWQKNAQKKINPNKVNYVHINYANDNLTFEYYLAQIPHNIKGCFITDSLKMIKNENTFLTQNKNTHIFLLQNNDLIAYGDPFISNNIYSIYNKYDILD